MNNTGAIKHRMKSVKQTVQISNAQKLVASSHIGKARQMLATAAPYHDRIRQTIAGVLSLSPDAASRFLDQGKTPCKRGMLVLTSDKGLAGSYNSSVIKYTEEQLAANPAQFLMVLGQVGRAALGQAGYTLDTSNELAVEPPTMFAAREIAEHIIDLYEKGEIDCLDVIYTRYTSSIRMEAVMERVFPLGSEAFGEPAEHLGSVIFEPGADSVLSVLMPKYIKGFLYGCLVHAWASELASRVTAMDNAIRNGNEMLGKLSKTYNRLRQAMITQEITEIVAGATSMTEE